MIQLSNVNFKYNNSSRGALYDISLDIHKGECVLLCGDSGCGKTTVTRLINGLIPHFYESELTGSVRVCGMNVPEEEIYTVSRKVGSVFQNPRSQFFCLDTSSELAFGCENLGMPVEQINERVKYAAEELELENLLDRDIFKLSGGEKQRIACGSVSAMLPDIIVLDEPTSNLDAESIELLKRILALWKKQNKTIIIAEHRLYWLKDICDRAVYLSDGKIQMDIPMRELTDYSEQKMEKLGLRSINADFQSQINKSDWSPPSQNEPDTITLKDYVFAYDVKTILDIRNLQIPRNEVIAITGQNGAGKSTFIRCLCGLQKKFKGRTVINSKEYKPKEMLKLCYLVMQDVNPQLFCETVEDEIVLGSGDTDELKVQELMEKLGLWEFKNRHPMSLSGGQKQRVAIASSMLAGKEILIFDEPTSGLDYRHMIQTAELFIRLKESGKSVLIITHDRELIRKCCTFEIHIAQGKAEVNKYESN